mgnify:CR=1 FL=1
MYLRASRLLLNSYKPFRYIHCLPLHKLHIGQPNIQFFKIRFYTTEKQSNEDTYVKREFKSDSEEFTRLLGREIAKFCNRGDAICLYG